MSSLESPHCSRRTTRLAIATGAFVVIVNLSMQYARFTSANRSVVLPIAVTILVSQLLSVLFLVGFITCHTTKFILRHLIRLFFAFAPTIRKRYHSRSRSRELELVRQSQEITTVLALLSIILLLNAAVQLRKDGSPVIVGAREQIFALVTSPDGLAVILIDTVSVAIISTVAMLKAVSAAADEESNQRRTHIRPLSEMVGEFAQQDQQKVTEEEFEMRSSV
ncbi:hypothetical protein C8J56DRAFT_882140 [Mycena floridula]|nr:hypothetical protein C8J56DRAFT_882140 [Mycena floridula]